jgi:RNA polymerase sigma-70 factor (ECF subfamily)
MTVEGESGASRSLEDGLIRRVLRRDERAFRTLYQTHTPSLYLLALRMTGGSDPDAEDVVQETWRRAVRGLAGFERRSSLRTWLSSIAIRCAHEVRRTGEREGAELQEGLPARDGRPSSVSEVDLARAFERLPAGFQAVLVLHDLEGYRHADIAELLGITIGTSKSQLSRARARMREVLGEDYRNE